MVPRTSAVAAAVALALLLGACKKKEEKASGGGAAATTSSEPGDVQEVLRHDSPEGAVLVTVAYRYEWPYRITSLDLATGTVLANRRVDQQPRCIPATTGRLWCMITGNPHLVDARTLNSIGDMASLARTEPLLASGVVQSGNPSVTADGSIVVVTGDGQHVRIDAATMAAKRMGPTDPAPGYWGYNPNATVSEVRFGDITYGFRGRAHDELELLVDQQAPPETVGGAAELALPAFLSPSLVVDHSTLSAAFQQQPPTVLIHHETSLIPQRSKAQLTLFEIAGRSRWTIEPGGTVKLAATSGGNVVMVLDATPRDLAVAFDLATGVERWRYAY